MVKPSHKFSIAENFNKFFRSIGKKLLHKINPTRRYYLYYLRYAIATTFFTSPTSSAEVKDNIQDLKTNKSTGPNGLPKKL